MGGQRLAGRCPVVFVSYSREDEAWRGRFAEMLRPLVRERRLEVWSDDRLVTGYEWRPQLAAAIARAQAALLLVSPSFLASDFIMDQELPALIQHGVRLVPVLVRPCLWQAVPILEGLQWAHDPKRDGPVAESVNQERLIVAACRMLNGLLADGSVAPPPPGLPGPAEAGLRVAMPTAVGTRLGDLHDVPPPPRAAVPREELAGLRAVLLAGEVGAIGVTGVALGVHGQGGIGKTVLAAALARDEQVRRHFPDGVLWVSVGEQGDLVAAQQGLLSRLGAPDPVLRSAWQGAERLRQVLAGMRCLLIVDDVWSAAAALAFKVTGPSGRVVYTTRDPAVLAGTAGQVVGLGVLPNAAARELLARLAGLTELSGEADRVLVATGGVALAVALVGAAIGAGQSWGRVAAQLKKAAWTFGDHPYASTFKAMQVGVAALDAADAAAYRSLAVYPEDTVIPATAVARLQAHLFGSTAAETAALLARLSVRSLITLSEGGVSFHDLQREFLLLHTDDLPLGHADLLAAYRALLPPGGSWARLHPGEPYIWDHLVFHLLGAGDGAAIRALACDLGWIVTRCHYSGPYAPESDLRQAAALFPDHPGIGWLLRLLGQWGHLLTGHSSPGDLAATLASRVHDAPAPIDSGALAHLLPACYLSARLRLPPAQAALARVLSSNADMVSSVAFTPDGRQLASSGRDGTVRVWDPATGQQVAALTGHDGWVNAVAFAPDGRLLASGGHDGRVRLWDPATGQQVATLVGYDGVIQCVAFAPDGRLLASAGSGGRVRLWDPATGQQVAVLPGHDGPAYSVAFAPDGRLLASGGDDGRVRLWDPATGQQVAVLPGHDGPVYSVAFAPHEHLLASADLGGTVRLWDAAAVRRVGVLADDNRTVWTVAFAPDGHLLASGNGDGTVQLWDSVAGQQVGALAGHKGTVWTVAFTPDGHLLASGGYDETVRLWDAATGQQVAALVGHEGTVRTVAFAPDGHLLASGGYDETVRLWDPATGQQVGVVAGHDGWVNAVAFAPDGHLLASGGSHGMVRIWDLVAGQQVANLVGHEGTVSAVAFAPDGHLLASGGCDGTVRLWDPVTGQQVAVVAGHDGWVNAVAFTPDGHLLASADFGGTVRLWEPAAARQVATLAGYGRTVWAVAFAPDGRLLASADGGGMVRLWDIRTAALISQLKTGMPLQALAWGPCGIVASGYQSLLHLAVAN